VFTGLIDDVGVIEHVASSAAGCEVRIACRYDDLADGESIAVNGACLTVREHGPGWFVVAAVVTTLDRTTVAAWTVGRRLNLERAMRVNDRLGGHLVQGHVDGVASVRQVLQRDDARLIDLALPAELAELTVLHGSIAVDGVSLTVNDVPASDVVQLSIIDYTMRHTTLGDLRDGDLVHVETDLIGKYVRRLTQPYGI
jgi:riboflavin synthase